MAQWNKLLQQYDNQNKTNFEVTICADRYGNIGICGDAINGLGIADGSISNMSAVHKFGLVEGTNSSGWSTIWTPASQSQTILYPWGHSSGVLSVESTSAQDGPAGSGTLTILVQGLDSNYELQEEVIILNGTNSVSGQLTFSRVFRANSVTGETNVGDINISIGGDLVAQIASEYGQTLQCAYTVPAGKTAYLKDFQASANKNQEIVIGIFRRDFGGVFRVSSTMALYQMSMSHTFEVPVKMDEKTDIDVRVKGATNATVSCDFELILVDND